MFIILARVVFHFIRIYFCGLLRETSSKKVFCHWIIGIYYWNKLCSLLGEISIWGTLLPNTIDIWHGEVVYFLF